MDSFLQDSNKKKGGINKNLILAGIGAVLILSLLIAGISLIPTAEEKKQVFLEDAYREGDPEFEKYRRNIIITNDPNGLKEARTGLGTIIMTVSGSIYNRGDKTLSGLEVSVGMVDTQNKLIKDKKVLFVPRYHPQLSPNETIYVSVNVAGFKDDDNRANSRWKLTAMKFAEEEGKK